MSDQTEAADRAYRAAQTLIEAARAKGDTGLSFDIEDCRALDRIPTEISGLTNLTTLHLDNTQVADLAPLSGLTGLQTLTLAHTAVADLTPLQGLTGLQSLALEQTAVADLTPLQGLTGLRVLSLNQTAVADLAPLQGLTGLQNLSFDHTAVADLAPLQGLTGLRVLSLGKTAVADLTPLQGLTGLQRLWLNQTAVADLRPIRDLALPTEQLSVYLWFTNTPATWQDPELLRLSGIEDNEQRTRETLAYLRTLPPWPEAYVPATARKGRPRQAVSEPQSANPDTRLAVPKGLKRLSLSDARHILEESRPLIRDRCQFVVAAIDDALANHLTRIPNEPEALQAHEVILNALTLSKAAIIGIYDAVPDDFTDQPIDDIAAGKLRAAFDRLLAQLKQAASYVDQKDHTPTYGGLLKLGSVTAIGSVLALVPGVTLVAAIPFLYACLYGPEAAKALGALLPKPGG